MQGAFPLVSPPRLRAVHSRGEHPRVVLALPAGTVRTAASLNGASCGCSVLPPLGLVLVGNAQVTEVNTKLGFACIRCGTTDGDSLWRYRVRKLGSADDDTATLCSPSCLGIHASEGLAITWGTSHIK